MPARSEFYDYFRHRLRKRSVLIPCRAMSLKGIMAIVQLSTGAKSCRASLTTWLQDCNRLPHSYSSGRLLDGRKHGAIFFIFCACVNRQRQSYPTEYEGDDPDGRFQTHLSRRTLVQKVDHTQLRRRKAVIHIAYIYTSGRSIIMGDVGNVMGWLRVVTRLDVTSISTHASINIINHPTVARFDVLMLHYPETYFVPISET